MAEPKNLAATPEERALLELCRNREYCMCVFIQQYLFVSSAFIICIFYVADTAGLEENVRGLVARPGLRVDCCDSVSLHMCVGQCMCVYIGVSGEVGETSRYLVKKSDQRSNRPCFMLCQCLHDQANFGQNRFMASTDRPCLSFLCYIIMLSCVTTLLNYKPHP